MVPLKVRMVPLKVLRAASNGAVSLDPVALRPASAAAAVGQETPFYPRARALAVEREEAAGGVGVVDAEGGGGAAGVTADTARARGDGDGHGGLWMDFVVAVMRVLSFRVDGHWCWTCWLLPTFSVNFNWSSGERDVVT